jgi:large subunit ribosomal protein L1
MAKHGKKYLEKATQVDRQKAYGSQEAVELLKTLSYVKFDETVELHMRMNVDPRRADQQIRSVVTLPAGTGKTVRIMAFMEGEAARLAQEAGADYVGTDEYVKKIQDGWLDFDVAMATPQVMGKIGRLGRVLGARGLMPNPKAGTVVQPEDIPNVIKQLRQGRVEFRVDKTSNLHIPIGKISFSVEQLMLNLSAVMEMIMRVKPSSVKGQYIRHITLAATMTPGLRLDPFEAQNLRVG